MNIFNKKVLAVSLILASNMSFGFSFDGEVVCDANQNGQIDAEDTPLENVSVEARGISYAGPFTTTTDLVGSYSLCLHCQGGYGHDIYDVTLNPSTLGVLAEVIIPAGGVQTADLSVEVKASDVNFLVDDPSCQEPVIVGGEGCTPGYWRQEHHYDSWASPYTPATLFSDVFEDAFPGLTLGEVVELKGGGLNALGRHTVAALLNTASDGVSYGMSTSDVINAFNDVFPSSKPEYNSLKNELDTLNNEGCPLN